MQDIGVEAFYGDIGVTPQGEEDDPTFSFWANGKSLDGTLWYGYLKFDSGWFETDIKQSNQFEDWLKSHGYSYYRGYPDDPDDAPDRRFHLSKEAALEVKRLWELREVQKFLEDF